MKILILSAVVLFSISALSSNNIKNEICKAFALEYSGDQTEWSEEADDDVVVHYDHDEVYNYCLGAIEPEKKSDSSGSYYEFDIFICSNVYQDATMAYTPDSKELDDLGGSGSGDSCPYASE